MKTIRYEVQLFLSGKWRSESTSLPTQEGLEYAMYVAEKNHKAGHMTRIIEIREHEKLIWPDVENCGSRKKESV